VMTGLSLASCFPGLFLWTWQGGGFFWSWGYDFAVDYYLIWALESEQKTRSMREKAVLI